MNDDDVKISFHPKEKKNEETSSGEETTGTNKTANSFKVPRMPFVIKNEPFAIKKPESHPKPEALEILSSSLNEPDLPSPEISSEAKVIHEDDVMDDNLQNEEKTDVEIEPEVPLELAGIHQDAPKKIQIKKTVPEKHYAENDVESDDECEVEVAKLLDAEKDALIKIKMLEMKTYAGSRFTGVNIKKMLIPGCLIIFVIILLIGARTMNSLLRPEDEAGKRDKGIKEKMRDKIMAPVDEHVKLLENELQQDGWEIPENMKPKRLMDQDAPVAENKNEPIPVKTPELKEENDDENEEFYFRRPDPDKPGEFAVENLNGFLKMLNSAPEDEVLVTRMKLFFRYYPDDLETHRGIVGGLFQINRSDLAKKEYLKWLGEVQRSSYAANMIGAIMFAPSESKAMLFERATVLARNSEEPYRRLIALYESQRNWRKVAVTASSMQFASPNNEWALRKEAEAKIRSGGNADTVIRELATHYKNRNFPKPWVAVYCLPLSQMFSLRTLSDEFLADLEEVSMDEQSIFPDYFKRFSIYQSLVFDIPLDPVMLRHSTSPETRRAQMFYFVSRKDFASALAMPTPIADQPDFWKMFIAWCGNDKSWIMNTEKILTKYEWSPVMTIPVIIEFWLGKIKPDELRSKAETFPAEDEPFIYFILALEASRSGRHSSANVLYMKAMESTPGIYSAMLNNYVGKNMNKERTENK